VDSSGTIIRSHPLEPRGGIDYAALRAQVSIREILARIHYEPLTIRGDQWRGPCPLPNHPTSRTREPTFSVHVGRSIYHCFRCHSRGDQIAFWAAFKQIPLCQAGRDLCREFHVDAFTLKTRNSQQPPQGTSNPATPGS